MNRKIIHLALGKANPERMNGVNKVVHALATTQKNLGYDAEVWGITKNTTHDYPERNYQTHLYTTMPIPFSIDPKLVIDIKQLKKESMFHIHGAFIPAFFSVAKLLYKHKIPFVYTSHGGFNKIAIDRNPLVKKSYYYFFESQILKWAHKAHYIGESELEVTKKFANKNILIPNGQRIEDLAFTFNKVVKHDSPIFGYCGRLALKEKGIDILLNGFARYKAAGGKGEIWIIGDGPDRGEIEKLNQKLHISQFVQILGSKYGNEKLNLIANMDWFVLTSRNEGLPTGVLEAAGLRVPCIISKETNLGVKVNAGNAGIVLDTNHPVALCNAFMLAYQNMNIQKQFGLNAYQMVLKEFNWETIAQQLLHHYHDKINL